MADFSTPFGRDGERRLPTTTERQTGFPCGPADRALFNSLFHRVEAEIQDVISTAGIVPTDTRNTLLREAIEALISAATGGNPAGYVLMTQARARLPIYPEVSNVDGKIVVTSPATGTVRLPGGIEFVHRGIFPVTTVQTDFITDPSKTYHMRWNPTAGFTLNDLASAVYNASGASESNAAFDSKYDDMLIARVITNSTNVPTITNLVNKDRYKLQFARDAAVLIGGTGTQTDVYPLDLARTPIVSLMRISENTTAFGDDGGESAVYVNEPSRYSVSVNSYARGISSGENRSMIYKINVVL